MPTRIKSYVNLHPILTKFICNLKRLVAFFLALILVIMLGRAILVEHKDYQKKIQQEQNKVSEYTETLNLATQYIKNKEGFRATPYRCSAGAKTIGYGDTTYVKKNPTVKKITEEQATEHLLTRVTSFYDILQSYKVMVGKKELSYTEVLSPVQTASLISFMYNLGDSSLKNSKLRSLIDQKITIEVKLQKQYAKNPKHKDHLQKDLRYTNVIIQKEFLKWSKIKTSTGYSKLEGLVTRRSEEAKMFLASN